MEITIKSDYFYCLHNDDMNTFIMQTVEPSIETSRFYIDDRFAYLLDAKTNLVVGFQFLNFFSIWLYPDRQMYEIWNDYNLKKYFNEWRKEDFEFSTIVIYLKREMIKNFGIVLTKENNND